MATINIYIDEETGDPIVDGEGFTGSACAEAMAQLLAWLGETQDVQRKPEYEQVQRQQLRKASR